VETAEALAEYWHKRIREEWGIGSQDSSVTRELFQQKKVEEQRQEMVLQWQLLWFLVLLLY